MRALTLMIALSAMLLIGGCGGDDSPDEGGQADGAAAEVETSGDASNRGKPEVAVPGGEPAEQLVENELIEGTGAEAKSGDEVTVQYVGVGYDSEEEFDSSWSRNEPFSFQLGGGQVIPGWEQGIEGMKVGGRRELLIPSDLAYGPQGAPPAIGPDEALVFVVDLLEVG